MKYTVTFSEETYDQLAQHLFQDRLVERAAYALCRISKTGVETRLLVREIILVTQEDIEDQTERGMKIKSRSFVRAMKKADLTKHVFMFIHSHPVGFDAHSQQDDQEEAKLFRTAYTRIKTAGVHGSLVMSSREKPIARIWLEDGTIEKVDLIRVIGNRFRFYKDLNEVDSVPVFFDRQIRAFGDDIQKILRTLHIGVVGVGGTGSAVAEQLIRMGIGEITFIDGQQFEISNVNRVYGSSVKNDKVKKIRIAKKNSSRIGLGTRINIEDKPISYLSSALRLRNCDVIFGCTDDNWGRSILTRLAVYYHIPVFDMGVKIDSSEGVIKSIQGRVTTLLADYACLFCRERISAKRIQMETLAELDPPMLFELQKQGYADELNTPSPAVIPFTTTIAAMAISEFLHRLTGFMGSDHLSNEILFMFDELEIRRNRRVSKFGCFCGDDLKKLKGDVKPFLDLTWRNEKKAD